MATQTTTAGTATRGAPPPASGSTDGRVGTIMGTRAARPLVTPATCRRSRLWLNGRLPSSATKTPASTLAAAVPGDIVVRNDVTARPARMAAPGCK
jgi:hypothetical protein